ncbi:DUF5060 domain-containing protein [Paenibacillus sp. FSL H8-0548]|uniref:DUF5605 domain-containing protein n=1 Tax=Paenibacillus sp. FSL H8-0548 TaxID=1920422 RepID=UPI00096F8354|nr:DUF5605 domain-containing protein [Paenibacillus sp. FSL H8-0548]OMF37761.1 DUF5060 domain-containing protein [Paenibacillus sp. FSL H8-0548]
MPAFNDQTKIGHIWANESARKVLLKHVPELEKSPYLSFMKMRTLPQLAVSNEAWIWPAELLSSILKELALIEDEAVRDEEPRQSADYESDLVSMGSAYTKAPDWAEKWGIFEILLKGPNHGNPFVDVAISAVFTCEERSVQVSGFYDGEGIYRIRFMPEHEGEWRYETISNARSLHGIAGGFICIQPSAGNNGPVRVKDTFHFAYENGMAYIPIGTTCYAWSHQGEKLETQTLNTLSASPFNKLRMCVFPKSYQFNENEPELYPYEGSLAQGWDYTRFNPAYFRHLENRIAELGELGIEADLILFHAYDRWGFSEMMRSADDRYLRYIVARLSAYRHIWWSLANEYDLMWAKEESDWERIAAIVTENDPYNHLISIHNCFAFYDYKRSWITHCSVQRIDVYRTAENTTEWRLEWNKPIVIDECAYEGNIDMGWGNITGQEMVRRFWEGAIRGGYVGHGETYLDPDDVLWWSKGGKLHGESSQRIAFLRTIMESGPEGGLNPLKSEWDAPSAGIKDQYYLFYYGLNQPMYRHFSMKPGVSYEVEVIDTWNMTIKKQPGKYEGSFRIELPGTSYAAVRMTKVG